MRMDTHSSFGVYFQYFPNHDPRNELWIPHLWCAMTKFLFPILSLSLAFSIRASFVCVSSLVLSAMTCWVDGSFFFKSGKDFFYMFLNLSIWHPFLVNTQHCIAWEEGDTHRNCSINPLFSERAEILWSYDKKLFFSLSLFIALCKHFRSQKNT